MNENLMREVVENIVEEADEILSKGKDNLSLVEKGQLLAYAETLTIIQGALSGYDLASVGLDFDIDAKYLA